MLEKIVDAENDQPTSGDQEILQGPEDLAFSKSEQDRRVMKFSFLMLRSNFKIN